MDNNNVEGQINTPSMRRKQAWIIVLVLVLIAAAVIYNYLSRPKAGPNVQSQPVSQNPVQQVPPDKLPRFLPADLPVEQGAEVLVNNVTELPGKPIQSTRQYVSSLRLEQNYLKYHDYFAGHGWTINYSDDTGTAVRTLFAVTKAQTANVVISSNAGLGKVVVDVTVTSYLSVAPTK